MKEESKEAKVMGEEDLEMDILGAFLFGGLDESAANALLDVLHGGGIIQEAQTPTGEKNPLGIQNIYHVKDIKGNPLVGGGIYMLRGKKVKVLREQFGSGNFLDKYYRVFYLDSDFKEAFICVDAKYQRGFNATYPSAFEPI